MIGTCGISAILPRAAAGRPCRAFAGISQRMMMARQASAAAPTPTAMRASFII